MVRNRMAAFEAAPPNRGRANGHQYSDELRVALIGSLNILARLLFCEAYPRLWLLSEGFILESIQSGSFSDFLPSPKDDTTIWSLHSRTSLGKSKSAISK
jgi:hypothetical protein